MTEPNPNAAPDNARPSFGPALGSARQWSVTVTVEGEDVLTIEPESYGGLSDVADYRREIIEAAENLLAFIGTGEETSFDFEDESPNAKVCGPINPKETND